jgi:gluconate 2-dehydrogenase subunit 3-like protein
MNPFRSPYVGYDVLAKWDTPSWDDRTREVIRRRLTEVPNRRFFSETEWQTLEAVCARLVPQPERSSPVPIVPWIDEKLHHNRRDGFRYADMPPLRAAWRLGLEGINQESRHRFGGDFRVLPGADQETVLRTIQAGDVEGGVWARLPPQRFFTMVLLKEVVGEYYAHPAAWSEVGFGGPAPPRGYVRLGLNQHDPWERHERDDSEAPRE